MRKGAVIVHGTGSFENLYEGLNSILSVGYQTRLNNGVLLFIDDHSLLNNSNVMTVILLEHSGDDCRVEIISGGGGDGLLGWTLGNESRRVDKVMTIIDQVCQVHSYQLTDYFTGKAHSGR
ncbi:MAG: hypothetical protein K0Q66_1542 [Chitinophagaceae bacterium]|nr:hypothetical protein [Chitinophagaceae bacterium]